MAFDPPPTHATTKSGSAPSRICAALLARLVADDPLELSHHPWERMRADHGADAVVRRRDARDPVAQRLVDRVLERRAAGLDGHDLGAEELHPKDVERLTLDVDRAHEDLALEAEERGRRRRGDAVLSGARLGDDALLAHPPREQRLAEHVVDLVRARVREVLALEQHAHAEAVRQPPALGDGRRPARVVGEQIGVFGSEPVVRPRGAEIALQVLEGGYQRLRHEPAAELAVPAEPHRLGPGRVEPDRLTTYRRCHGRIVRGRRRKARRLSVRGS